LSSTLSLLVVRVAKRGAVAQILLPLLTLVNHL
jgi:hypothetical protein